MINGAHLNTGSTAKRLVVLSDKGEIKDEITFNGYNLSYLSRIGENRWIATTTLGIDYLVNEKGEGLADVTNAAVHGKWLFSGGKIYDQDMNLLLDYGKDGTTVLWKMSNGVLLRKSNNDVVCFTGSETLKVETAGDDKFTYFEAGDDYYIVRNTSDALGVKYDIYNDAGTKIYTTDGVRDIYSAASGDNAVLLYGYDENYNKVYFRLEK